MHLMPTAHHPQLCFSSPRPMHVCSARSTKAVVEQSATTYSVTVYEKSAAHPHRQHKGAKPTANESIGPAHRFLRVLKLYYKVASSQLPAAKKSAHGGSQSATPATKSAHGGSPSAAPATKSAHGGSQSVVPATKSAHGGSQSAVPARKSAHGGSQSAAPATKSALQETSENSNPNGRTIRA